MVNACDDHHAIYGLLCRADAIRRNDIPHVQLCEEPNDAGLATLKATFQQPSGRIRLLFLYCSLQALISNWMHSSGKRTLIVVIMPFSRL